MEMGADVVKLNMPKLDPDKDKDSPAPYNELRASPRRRRSASCVESAGRSLVVLSGGSKIDDDTLLEQTRAIMEAGGSGVIYGRNVWQREWSEALEIIEQIKEIMLASVSPDPLAGSRGPATWAPGLRVSMTIPGGRGGGAGALALLAILLVPAAGRRLRGCA